MKSDDEIADCLLVITEAARKGKLSTAQKVLLQVLATASTLTQGEHVICVTLCGESAELGTVAESLLIDGSDYQGDYYETVGRLQDLAQRVLHSVAEMRESAGAKDHAGHGCALDPTLRVKDEPASN